MLAISNGSTGVNWVAQNSTMCIDTENLTVLVKKKPNLFKRLLLEMNYVSNVDEVVEEEGIMCISGFYDWDEINWCFEDVDVSKIEDEVKDFIKCEIYSDEDIKKLM